MSIFTGCMDARQRSGSIAASTFSTGSIPDQQVQRNMSYSVPTLNAGSRQFNTKGNIFRQRRDFSVFQVRLLNMTPVSLRFCNKFEYSSFLILV